MVTIYLSRRPKSNSAPWFKSKASMKCNKNEAYHNWLKTYKIHVLIARNRTNPTIAEAKTKFKQAVKQMNRTPLPPPSCQEQNYCVQKVENKSLKCFLPTDCLQNFAFG